MNLAMMDRTCGVRRVGKPQENHHKNEQSYIEKKDEPEELGRAYDLIQAERVLQSHFGSPRTVII